MPLLLTLPCIADGDESGDVLQDHSSIEAYPGVRGMQQPLFFWQHNHTEGGDGDTKSKSNIEEARMAAKLAKYLVQQGYRCMQPANFGLAPVAILPVIQVWISVSNGNLEACMRCPSLDPLFGNCLIRSGEVTILTPYVGQLMRLREEVSHFTVCMLDERDADQLADLQVC